LNTGKTFKIFERISVYILLSFLMFILVSSLLARAEYCGYKYYDNPVWNRQDFFSLILAVLVLLCAFVLLYKLGRTFNRFERKSVIFTIILLSASVQVLFILLFPANQFADQDAVNTIAYMIIQGDYSAFQERGYLYLYPNNIGISLFLSLLYRICPIPLLLPKLLNVLFSSITTYLIFRIYEETIGAGREINYSILVLSGFFLPVILLNNLVYNDIYSTTFFTGAVYYAERYVKTRKRQYLMRVGAMIIAGDFLRPLGLIFIIAIFLYFAIRRLPVAKMFAFFAVVFILCKLPLYAVNIWLLSTGKISEPVGVNSIPIHMWLNIGMNEQKFGYWDDSYSFNIYINEGQWNKERSIRIYRELIKKTIDEKGVLGIANTYLKKNIWLWTEGTYQAEYYGIGSWGYMYQTLATDLLSGNTYFRDGIRWFLHVVNLLILSLSFCGLVKAAGKKYEYPLILQVIVILGFIGFYTLWEIKPRYIYPAYPYLILTSFHGLSILEESFSRLFESLRKRQERIKPYEYT